MKTGTSNRWIGIVVGVIGLIAALAWFTLTSNPADNPPPQASPAPDRQPNISSHQATTEPRIPESRSPINPIKPTSDQAPAEHADLAEAPEALSRDEQIHAAERALPNLIREQATAYTQDALEWRSVEVASYETFETEDGFELQVHFYVEYSGRSDDQYWAIIRFEDGHDEGQLVGLQSLDASLLP